MLKKLLAVLAVLVLIAGAGIYFLGSNLDSFVRTAIEKYGSAATQTTVKLDGVKIAPSNGAAGLFGLSVGSPAGFTADKSFFLGNIAVKLDISSVSGTGPIVIDEIMIDKPQITYEVNKDGSNNLQTIAKNAQAYAASLGGGKNGESKAAENSDQKKPGRKLIIKNLTVSNGQIGILQPLLPKPLSASLPTIHLTNIGKNEGGASAAEVAQQLITAITNSASQIAVSDLSKALGDNLKNAADAFTKTKANDIGNQVKGLFGK